MRKRYESPAFSVNAMDTEMLLVGISDEGFDPNAPQEVNYRCYGLENDWEAFWEDRE